MIPTPTFSRTTLFWSVLCVFAVAQPTTFEGAAQDIQAQLEQSLKDLAALREQISTERGPLTQQLHELETALLTKRSELNRITREAEGEILDSDGIRRQIENKNKQVAFIQSFMGDYLKEFRARLHVAELPMYSDVTDHAVVGLSNGELSGGEIQARLLTAVEASVDRLFAATGGYRFKGQAVDSTSTVQDGTFAVVGPVAVFRSADGTVVGSAEQRRDSLTASILAFPEAPDGGVAANLVTTGLGSIPVDPTNGNAHKMAATKETFWEHLKKGGNVMIPIGIMAGLAFVIALYKWARLAIVRKPSRRQMTSLLEAVSRRDHPAAVERAKSMRGPAGRMLLAGAEHLGEPKELIEEVMFERMLTDRLSLQRWLPFIAIAAASAPLLGLLGTVTGIIDTFKSITVFGSSDVKSLSGGISEALITTKFGLIVAIPSLLLHAFLSRKARSITSQMEQAAISFVNEVGRADAERGPRVPDVREQVEEALAELLGPWVERVSGRSSGLGGRHEGPGGAERRIVRSAANGRRPVAEEEEGAHA